MPSRKTGKPAQGEGNIYPLEDKPKNRCTKWRIVIPLGKLDGKYKQRKETFHGTYTEAHARRREMVIERDGRPWDADTTVGEWLDDFNAKRAASGELSRRTQETDKRNSATIKLHLAECRFGDLTTERINQMYSDLRAGKSLSGKPLSGTTLHSVHSMLILALREPMKKGLVHADLFEGAIAPKRDTKEKRTLSTPAASSFMMNLDPNDPSAMAVLLCVAMGMRRSESLGTMWTDVEYGVLHLRHGIEEDGTLKNPKTAAGIRSLPIPRIIMEALEIRRNAQRKLAILMVHGLSHTGPIDHDKVEAMLQEQFPFVCSDKPTPKRPHSLSVWWTRHRRDYGITITLHELRHTFLTMLARAKVHPKVMQELAGHASAQITMEIYTHVDIEEKAKAIQTLDAVLLPQPQPNIIEVPSEGNSSNFLPPAA